MNKLAGRSIFITGASAGIGASLARRAYRDGASLTLTARRLDRLSALVKEFDPTGTRAIAVQADVTRDGDLEEARARAREAFGGIDIVIANAGFGVSGKLEDLTLDDYRRQFETNVFGVLRTVYATLPELTRSRGTLALLGSVATYASPPGSSAYNMSKAAIHALAATLRAELRPKGIGVVLLSPGFVESEIRVVDNEGHLREGASDPVPSWLVMPSDKAACQILDAIVRRERERVITVHGKIAASLGRHTPGLLDAALSLGTRKRNK